jgi:MYXO-CTERM domain-containing protein
MTPGDVAIATQVVAERSRLASGGAELDVAWLRLDREVTAWPPLAAIRREPLANQTPLVVVSATAGVPIKIDPGATVSQARSAENDYFVADSDTFHGSSGAGAFDENGALVGILSRGKEDFTSTDAGCNLTLHEPASAAAERYSHATQAVATLCASGEGSSALCGLSCPEPCADAPRFIAAGGGCAVQSGRTPPDGVGLLVSASMLAIALRRKRQRSTFGAVLHSRRRRIK